MHSKRWAGQFHIANVCLFFSPCKGRLEEVEERAEREEGRGRREGADEIEIEIQVSG